MKTITKLAGAALLLAAAQYSFANPCPPGNPPTNCGPPENPTPILDLNGTPVPHTYTEYTVNFTATAATTNVSFAFREDPAFLELDNVSVTTGGGPNLLADPGFESGLGPWVALNNFGATFAGQVSDDCGVGSSRCWYDGSVQGYDGLSQAIATTPGDTYTLSFWLDDDGGLRTFSDLSTNGNTTNTGGNGIDLLAYAGVLPTITPPAVPEPGTLALFGLGLGVIALGFARRRRVLN